MLSDLFLKSYLQKVGIDAEAAKIYLTLHTHGPQSIMQLARNARIERTRIYRLLDILSDYSLVEEEVQLKRKMYHPAPLTNLEITFGQRKQQLKDLEEEMHRLNKIVTPGSRAPLAGKILFYHGMEGIKQMKWNETRSTTENLSILHENLQGRAGSAFFERWVERCGDKLAFRGIIDDHFISTQQQWYEKHLNKRLSQWSARHIHKSIYTIMSCTVIYDDIVAFYDWRTIVDAFGVEIHDQGFAASQRQLFEMLWERGIDVNDVTGEFYSTRATK